MILMLMKTSLIKMKIGKSVTGIMISQVSQVGIGTSESPKCSGEEKGTERGNSTTIIF